MKKIISCIMPIVFIGFISLFIITMIVNNFRLKEFAEQLFDVEFPSDIAIMEERKICGKLNGNGNSMDYLACLLVKSKRDKTELTNLLDHMTFKCIGDDRSEYAEKEVVKVEDEMLQSKYLLHQEIKFESLTEETDFGNYYAIIIYDGGYAADFDIRAH